MRRETPGRYEEEGDREDRIVHLLEQELALLRQILARLPQPTFNAPGPATMIRA